MYDHLEKQYGPSRHYTIVFSVFVYMQVFNMICARKINDEKNVFAGFFSNSMYVSIVFTIAIVQAILTQFSGDIFKCARAGISVTQWIIVLVLGVSVLPVNYLIKFVPDKFGIQLGSKEKVIEEGTLIHQFRSGRTVSITKKTTNRLQKLDSTIKNK